MLFANPLFVLTSLGLVLFALSRGAYDLYYSRYEVTPEEVGIDYVGLLSRQAFSIALVLVLVFYLSLPVVLGYYLKRRRVRRMRDDPRRVISPFLWTYESSVADGELAEAEQRLARSGIFRRRRSLMIGAVGLVVTWLVALFVPAATSGKNEHLSPFYSPFQVQVVPTNAFWVQEDETLRQVSFDDLNLDASQLHCDVPSLLLLGRASSILVLFEQCSQRTLRIPETLIVLG